MEVDAFAHPQPPFVSSFIQMYQFFSVELNVAVLSSFARHRVSIVDHHTASRQFILHQKREEEAGHVVPADWGWIVPPISGSTTPVFHTPYTDMRSNPIFSRKKSHGEITSDVPGWWVDVK